MTRTKPATGTVVPTKDGRLQGIITLVDGSRRRLKPFPRGTSQAMAEERTAYWAGEYRKQGATRKKPLPPVVLRPGDSHEPWLEAWVADRKARGYTATDDSLGHYRKHVAPSIGDKHIRDWTPADLRKLCRELDAKVAAGELSWKTAFNVWGTVTKMCDDACCSKLEELRVREDNPASGVRGPDRGADKLKQFLYPSEAMAFLKCADVPHRAPIRSSAPARRRAGAQCRNALRYRNHR